MVTEGKYTYCSEYFMMYIIVKSLCCTPETNVIYISYTLKQNLHMDPGQQPLVQIYNL